MSEQYANKRMLFRNGGAFAKTPTLESMGFDVADGPMTCVCGHSWRPIVKTGVCPKCGSKEKKEAEG